MSAIGVFEQMQVVEVSGVSDETLDTILDKIHYIKYSNLERPQALRVLLGSVLETTLSAIRSAEACGADNDLEAKKFIQEVRDVYAECVRERSLQ